MPRFLIPTFSFYLDWYWWLLLLVLFGSTYVQGVGFNLEQQSGMPRNQFGAMYAYSPVIRPFIWLGMLFLSGWVSMIASIVAMFLFSILASGIVREHARTIIRQLTEKQ
jgi:hypothetical protein